MMNAELSPNRIEEMITTAVRRGSRTRTLRLVGAAAASVGLVAAMALGGVALMNTPITNLPDVAVPPADSSPATPAPTTQVPQPSTEVPQPPAEHGPTPTEIPPTADPLATADFLQAYTAEEQELILTTVASVIEDRDPDSFVVVVSRTTHVDGLKALSPDVWIDGADETPAFALRISGPLGEQVRRGHPLGVDIPTVQVIGIYSLFGTDGTGLSGAQLFEQEDGSRATMPPVVPELEHDVALIDLTQVELPTLPDPDSTPLSDEEQGIADELLEVLQQLLPEGVEVSSIISSSPDGLVFDVRDADGTARGMLALWHLHPGAGSCTEDLRCTIVPVEQGVVHVDAIFDGEISRTRHYTYKRPDDAAIYFTLHNSDLTDTSGEGTTHPALPLTDEQVIDLLTDLAWTPHLDRKKAEPPQ